MLASGLKKIFDDRSDLELKETNFASQLRSRVEAWLYSMHVEKVFREQTRIYSDHIDNVLFKT
jgi:hypothetical protein